MSFFSSAKEIPPDPIFGLNQEFKQDPRANKVDLMVGVFRDKDLLCTQMECVKKAALSVRSKDLSPNYLPFLGDEEYLDLSGELLFGKERYQNNKPRIVASQGIGGTGALYNGGLVLQKLGYKKIWVPNPTWANHNQIFSFCGFDIDTYPYFDISNGKFQFDQLLDKLNQVEKGDVVLLHTCCHNPSGRDPSKQQWREISQVIKKREAIAFFDTAYQGFKKSVDKDVDPIRLFLDEGHEFLTTQSFSKNFTLYNERTSCLFIISNDGTISNRLASSVKYVIRASYSNPPSFGPSVVKTILGDRNLKSEWLTELELSRNRLNTQRELLVNRLSSEISSRNWDSLRLSCGMFLFIGLDPAIVLKLRDKYAIYMTGQGRINVSGLNDKNINYVVESIARAI
ncbi:MAG: aromatic amino acid transaminase [Rhabdochlamydiaceae bacterium]|nr:aromatic amino acid transaminase [Candidatus Amphrikana amoebophyrae]